MKNSSTLGMSGALALFAAIGFSGCSDRAGPAPAGRKTIAVIPKGTTHPFWKSVEAGARTAGEEHGFDVIWKGALVESDRGQQIQIIRQFVSQNVDGIVLAPLDARASGIINAVKDATAAGIPVVIMDSSLNAEAGTDYVTFAATSNKQAGRQAGEKLAELLQGSGNVVILRYMEGSASTESREEGCIEALREHPGIDIIADPFAAGNGTIADAMNRAMSMAATLERADGIFASNDPTTVGMLRALKARGLAGKVKFVGFDASRPSVEALRSGEIHALVAQDPFNMGYQSVQALARHLNGEPVDPVIDTGSGILTLDTLDTAAGRKLLQQAE